MILPDEIVVATSTNPKRLFIFSNPKVGKTTLMAQLPNALLIDLEEGSDFVSARKVKASNIDELREISDLIKAKNALCSPGKFHYDYIILDTVTALEDLVKPLALKMYQATPRQTWA